MRYPAENSGLRTLQLWIDDEGQAVCCTIIVHASNQMHLPKGLKEIGEEAFCGMAAEEFILPAGTTEIGARAFADCANLVLIEVPDTVGWIAGNAFQGSDGVAILCTEGSVAADYAERMGILCIAAPAEAGE